MNAERLDRVGRRLQGQSIRMQHAMAEAYIECDWYAVSQLYQRSQELWAEGTACIAAAKQPSTPEKQT